MSAAGGGEEGLRVPGGPLVPERELTVEAARSGGPGGQNVNKVATKVVLRFAPGASSAFTPEQKERLLERLAPKLTRSGELVLHSSAHRERLRNLDAARRRLADILGAALQRPRKRKRTRPTLSSKRRRVEQKRRRGDLKRQRGGSEG